MSAHSDLSNLGVRQFAERLRSEMVPLNASFSYYSVGVPFTEEDTKEYLEEPIAALPPAIASVLPKIFVLLVPYLQRKNGKEHHGKDSHGKEKSNGDLAPVVALERTSDAQVPSSLVPLSRDEAVLVFALEDQEVADYHYRFYHMLAVLMAERWQEAAQTQYNSLLREELNANVHGEVDEESWRAKQGLLRRQTSVRRETKPFLAYARQSFVDTLTLYLHGICCDIDVETGPRQLPSRFLRKRLQLIHTLFPPPKGYAVFPEDLNARE